MKQQVRFVAHTRSAERFDDTDAFEFRKDRPMHWLQKVCLFMLRKLGAYHIGETVVIERHEIDDEAFMRRIFEQKMNLYRFFDMEPKELLIGAEDYAEMMDETASSMSFQFHAEYWKDRRVLGLSVRVIPWMRGILVMPKQIF